MEEKRKILIVDDDPDIIDILNLLLRGEGYETVAARDGKQAVELADKHVDLIILDVMLPELNGFHACNAIREKTNAPILFLSAMSGDSEKSTAFLAGGDDYLCKPFSSSELVARVKSLLRRYYVYRGAPEAEGPKSDLPAHSPLHSESPDGLDDSNGADAIEMRSNNSAMINGQEIKLTYTEYEILHLLLRNRGKILSSQEIFEKIWAEPYSYNANNTVMVHILKLRKKIEKDTGHPEIIRTAWGRGYYIEKNPDGK